MRKPVSVTISFVAPAGSNGSVTLRHDAQCGDKARLAIDMGHRASGNTASAPLTVDSIRQLVDGLMDCIYALERKGRFDAGNKDQ